MEQVLIIKNYPFHFMGNLEVLAPKVNIPANKLNRYKGKKLVKSLQNDNTIDANNYENIFFCKFRLNLPNVKKQGVYLWVVDNEVVYIGETINLRNRFNIGYGNISPRNIFAGGQSTNCKMNRVAMQYFEQSKAIKIYFYETDDRKNIEKDLLKCNKENVKWNLHNDKMI